MDRYEEALAKARTEYEKASKQGYTWLMDLLEGMFPDLRESEDERIRQAIMEVLKRVSGATDVLENQGTTFKKAMIWLEKQKEYPTNEEMLRTLHVEYEKGVADTIAKYEQKEQKPAEWSEDDEKMRQRIIRHIESEYQDWCKDEYGNSEIVSDGKESCRERIAWLKSLRPPQYCENCKLKRSVEKWKPSQAQMRSLNWWKSYSENLASLHEDLEKLMEDQR